MPCGYTDRTGYKIITNAQKPGLLRTKLNRSSRRYEPHRQPYQGSADQKAEQDGRQLRPSGLRVPEQRRRKSRIAAQLPIAVQRSRPQHRQWRNRARRKAIPKRQSDKQQEELNNQCGARHTCVSMPRARLRLHKLLPGYFPATQLPRRSQSTPRIASRGMPAALRPSR